MPWQDVIRDVEAGGSNPLTPTTKPLGTELREQPGPGVSAVFGAFRGRADVTPAQGRRPACDQRMAVGSVGPERPERERHHSVAELVRVRTAVQDCAADESFAEAVA